MSRSALDTPMMRQFLAIKARCPDAILFYRMGDFYEMFLADAERAAPLLDIQLTTRDKGKPDAVPMCGFPVHSAAAYVKRLTDLGHRVAICEQVEDPRASAGRRLVKREIVEVITPGLVGEPEGSEARLAVALAAVDPGDAERDAGLALLDASTGDFRATRIPRSGEAQAALPATLLEELQRISPREILLPEPSEAALRGPLAAVLPATAFSAVDAASFEPSAAPAAPDGFDRSSADPAMRAAAAMLAYLGVHRPFAFAHTARLHLYRLSDTMILDAATRAHLELFENSEDRSRRATLIERLDCSCTPLGARRLARWLGYPLIDRASIAARQDAVAFLGERDRARARLREALRGVRDIERQLGRVARPTADPRDLGALRTSLAALPAVRAALAGGDEVLLADPAARPPALALPEPVPEVVQLLNDALVDEPPAVARGSRGASETGYIRQGYSAELDGIRERATKGREWIAGQEAVERERTGIASLKVRYHPVHGYSLEVPKSQLSKAPAHFERKQTLANAERFTTPELREVEQSVLGANQRTAELEREIFESVRTSVLEHAARIAAAADALAQLDALAALAEVARADGWTRPRVDESHVLEIRGGRHPVIEPLLLKRREEFVPNDTDLDPSTTQILLLTGPNMSGKSTYLRQVALIALLAQMGSFVPAESARIGVIDRVFTRVGASDRLARGESTFLVEMRETAQILSQASSRSLVILDEIGRGTSTYDGLSIAWAVLEYLHDTRGLTARTLFATHYHELTDLVHTKSRVNNAHFEAREWGDEVIFLRRLVAGAASRSYGIQVAQLAGLPATVIERAREILRNLEGGEFDEAGLPRLASHGAERAADPGQLGLFGAAPPTRPAEREVLDALGRLDPQRTTPVEALVVLHDLVARLRRGDET